MNISDLSDRKIPTDEKLGVPSVIQKRLQIKSVKKIKSTTPYVPICLKRRFAKVPRAPSTRKILTPSLKNMMKPIKLIIK